MALDLAKTFLSWIFILPAVFLAGAWFRPLVALGDVLLEGVVCCALGLAVVSYGVVLLDVTGQLHSSAIWILLLGLIVLSLGRFPIYLRWLRELAHDLTKGHSRADKLFRVIFFVSFLTLLMGTLSPEIGGDALCYQLNLPKTFLARGSAAPDYYDLNSYFPMLLNHLFLSGLASGGVFAAKLFHFFCGFLLFIAIKRITEQETQNETLAWFTALGVWLIPVMYNGLSTTYVDGGVALYTFLALWILKSALANGKGHAFLLSGFLMGCAVAIKYLALISTFALAVVWAVETIRSGKILKNTRLLILGILGFGAACGYWLVRNWFLTHNPIFPYLGNVFGSEAIPVNLSLHGFHAERTLTHCFLLLPFAVCAARFVREARYYTLFSVIYLFIWACLLVASDRYLLPVLPAIGLTAAYGIQWCLVRFPSGKPILGGLGASLLGLYLIAGVFHYRYVYPLFLGRWSPHQYLEKMERTIPPSDWVNQNVNEESKILLLGEVRQFYFDRPLVRDDFLRYRTHYDRRLTDARALSRFLKSEGFTHLLMAERISDTGDKPSTDILQVLTRSRFVKHLETLQSRNIRDDPYQYQIYQLHEAG